MKLVLIPDSQIRTFTSSGKIFVGSKLSIALQSRTDRIVFKLFGKDPNDFPLVLRKQ
ncbi:UNVERIFIED_CONTAM: Squamosa promoter-binding-like protein 12, partial [Sesamum latifolium]